MSVIRLKPINYSPGYRQTLGTVFRPYLTCLFFHTGETRDLTLATIRMIETNMRASRLASAISGIALLISLAGFRYYLKGDPCMHFRVHCSIERGLGEAAGRSSQTTNPTTILLIGSRMRLHVSQRVPEPVRALNIEPLLRLFTCPPVLFFVIGPAYWYEGANIEECASLSRLVGSLSRR